MSAPSIGIVGSGPAACYLAQALRRSLPDAELVMYERLAVPFGLIRYGVAPDHQNTKSIQAQFARLFERGEVRFAGNIDVGADITLDELRAVHDVVVLATGLSQDRKLGVPGDDKEGVVGAGLLTRRFNAHPRETEPLPQLGPAVAIVGGGNVSVDIVRILAKTAEEFEGSDIDETALEGYQSHPVTRIDLLCRRGPRDVPMDPVMVAELGKIDGIRFHLPAIPVPGAEDDRTTAARLNSFASLPADDSAGRVDVHVRFHTQILAVTGEGAVTGVKVRADDGEESEIPTDTVVTAVGFDFSDADTDLAGVVGPSELGQIAPGLYRAGWLRRGARGTIAENRVCARTVADEIFRNISVGSARPGYAGLPENVRATAVDYEGWQRIDDWERSQAGPGRVRRKTPNHADMLAVAHATRD